MKKKGKQSARLPKRVPRPEKEPEGKIGVSIETASLKYANATRFDPESYKKIKEQRQQQHVAPPVRSRHAGPGLDLLDVPPAPDSTTIRVEMQVDFAKMLNSTGVCAGCLEKINTVKDHPWWCPWWDTEEGKAVSPF